jgi:hypothetical protein
MQAPLEAVERVAGKRSPQPESDDILITREPAGRPGTAGWRYALETVGQSQVSSAVRYFSRYDAAAMEGEQLAAERGVRLFYDEDGTAVLLMDYRPAAQT